ncbi:hypothetical protein ACFPB0_14720, partial [Glycocaulis abyssi]
SGSSAFVGPVPAPARAAAARPSLGMSLTGVARLFAPLAILEMLQPGARNDPHIPIYRAVSGAELTNIYSTTPASFQLAPGMLEAKQFFLSLGGAQQYASNVDSGADAIVMTRIRPTTMAQGEALGLPSGESAGAAAVSFPAAALPALNRDAAQSGIQVVQSCQR